MSKNRKNESMAVRFGPALKVALVCCVIAASAIGQVWQKNQIYRLGLEIKSHELRLEELRRQNQTLVKSLAEMSSPRELEARVKSMNLGLAAPQPDQIVRMNEPANTATAEQDQATKMARLKQAQPIATK